MSASGASPPTAPRPWRVRFGGQVFRVKDEASLRRMVASGKVPADAEVEPPGTTGWQPLARVLAAAAPAATAPAPGTPTPAATAPSPGTPAPAGPDAAAAGGRDPWSLWERLAEDPEAHPVEPLAAAEDVEEVASVDSAPPAAPSLPPRARPATPPPPLARPASPPGAPGPALPPPARPRRDATPPTREDNVIVFPGPRALRTETAGPHALAPEPVAFPAPAPPPPRRPPPAARSLRAAPSSGTNWWRVAAVGALGLVIVGSWAFYVSMTSTAEFGARPLPPTVPSAPPGAVQAVEHAREAPVAAAEEAPPLDPYTGLEGELRAQLLPGLQPAESADQLETGLLIELVRVRVDVARVEVTVLQAVEGGEVPDAVELRLRIRSQGQLDREIGAIALVLGKYAQLLDLSMPLIELSFEGIEDQALLKLRLDVGACRDLYTADLGLGDFLARLAR